LALSNFLGAFFDSFFYFYYKNTNINCIDESSTNEECIKAFIEINNSQICKLLGLSHNFFQLYSVCWTSMLTLLFYRSTNSSNNMNKKSKRYIIIGFLYSTVICIIISLIPYITGDNYGFNRFYCSFRYYHDIEKDGKGYYRDETSNWSIAYFTIISFNLFFHMFCLIKTYRFYSEKSKIIKQQDKNEYKSFIIFVWIFRIFPIVILISRLYRIIARVLVEFVYKTNNKDDERAINIIEYINSFIFASNGIIISLASLVFFRGVFNCSTSKAKDERISCNSIEYMKTLEDIEE
jgi:hypothetical protein